MDAEILGRARRLIDAEFGDGYAMQHPELVGAWLQSEASHRIANQLKWLGVGDAATTMGALEFVGVALEKIATAIEEST
jgi:hypothetical protein